MSSGIAGIVAVLSYLSILLPWPETQLSTSTALVVVSAWPILSIVYSYGLPWPVRTSAIRAHLTSR